MVVLYYIKGLGFSDQKISPKNQLHNTILAPWHYWLGVTKLKSASSMTLNASDRLLQTFRNFLLTSYLMPSGKHNSIVVIGIGLISSPFDVTLSRDVHFDISQYVQYTHHGLTVALFSFVSHSFLLTVPRNQFTVA